MRVFVAGVMQGSRADDNDIHPQDYRGRIMELVAEHVPGAEFVEPHAENPDRLAWDRERKAELFLRNVAEAGRSDLLIAWLPEASMGTAVEMYEAYRAGVPILAVSALASNWTVFSLASHCLPSLDALRDFLAGPEFRQLTQPTPAAG